MFEREDNTKRFFIEAEGWDEEALKLGFGWLFEFARQNDHTVVGLVVASKRQIENLNAVLGETATKALLSTRREVAVNGFTLKAILESTSMPFEFREGPLLAVWTRDDRLEKVDGLYAPAICAITWSLGAIEAWKAAWGPVDLRTGTATAATTVGNPVVVEALKSLTSTVNLSTGLGHPSDRSSAISTFKLLIEGGEHYEPDEVRAWAASHGWQADDATELGEVSAKVKAGRRLKTDWPLRKEALEMWREAAREGADEKES